MTISNCILKKYQDDGYQAHYRAKFDYNGVHYEDISVTDPDYDAARTEYAGLVFGETYIIVSIGEEFNDRHYKIIAKIFELVYTIENNRFKLFHDSGIVNILKSIVLI